MSSLLITNIKELHQVHTTKLDSPKRGKDLANIPSIKNAYLLAENGIISSFGEMEDCPENAAKTIDAKGKMVLPTWCDSHTHLVFAKTREQEFVYRIKGMGYEEIAEKGGGILNSAEKLRNTSEDELFEDALARLHEVISYGTGSIEIKSGYGLTLESELKMLRVIHRLKEKNIIPIKTTFLGAHTIPKEYKQNREGYINLLINEMLPKISNEGLADYIDVFCEKVAFTVAETEQIIEAGIKHGLQPKIHTNQFNSMGGIELCVKHNALSVDHLEVMTDEEINHLANSNTIGTMLPSAPFFLNDPYPKGRKLIDGVAAVALATDYNPGSTPSGNMQFILSLACTKMKMLPEEAINAATINGAFAMQLNNTLGTISVGKLANLIITKPMESLAFVPYSFGSNTVDQVIINGKVA